MKRLRNAFVFIVILVIIGIIWYFSPHYFIEYMYPFIETNQYSSVITTVKYGYVTKEIVYDQEGNFEMVRDWTDPYIPLIYYETHGRNGSDEIYMYKIAGSKHWSNYTYNFSTFHTAINRIEIEDIDQDGIIDKISRKVDSNILSVTKEQNEANLKNEINSKEENIK